MPMLDRQPIRPGHYPINFDPNDMYKTPWATYVPGRNGADFKVHGKRGFALSAMDDHCVLYEFDFASLRWKEVLRRERGGAPLTCEDCGVSLNPRDYRTRGHWVIVKRNSRVVEPLEQRYVCPPCK